MTNIKSFNVTTEIKIRRPVWRWLGLGDQPSKEEVKTFFEGIISKFTGGADSGAVEVRYMGSPGYYLVKSHFTGQQPYWRRMGFGDTASRAEVKWHFVDQINTVAQSVSIIVEIEH